MNGVAVAPSPVKKKLSLSDYKSRMSKKPTGVALKAPSAITEEGKSPTPTDVHMLDSPITERTVDP
jgi:hypothetical protein